MIPPCHTSLNVFHISSKTLLTSNPSSKKLYISCVLDNSRLMQKSPGLKPDWHEEMSLFKKFEHFIKH